MDLCPLCAAPLLEIRSKAVCSGCGRIVEGCCEGAASACIAPPAARLTSGAREITPARGDATRGR